MSFFHFFVHFLNVTPCFMSHFCPFSLCPFCVLRECEWTVSVCFGLIQQDGARLSAAFWTVYVNNRVFVCVYMSCVCAHRLCDRGRARCVDREPGTRFQISFFLCNVFRFFSFRWIYKKCLFFLSLIRSLPRWTTKENVELWLEFWDSTPHRITIYQLYLIAIQ